MDLDPYMLVLKIRMLVTDTFEIQVEHEPRWYLKGPPLTSLPQLEDFGLFDVDPALFGIVPSPSAPSAEDSLIFPETEIVDLDFDLINVDPALLGIVPSPLALLAEGSRVFPETEIVDLDSGLIDVDSILLGIVPSPPVESVEGSCVFPKTEIVDLTSDTDVED
ncbi:hypothetical protein CJ030_MR5G003602 [Morella rubra]|uniref:Uncharacterized protein n=1 Tax=Morella rubra TaxID=262757 RepID=A0A6A1VNI4_9ROSI|nr:hypothetical protein CJ030_MR5G003602 [Morella rubra]